MLERVVKGFANHRRIQMLRLLERDADLTLLDICTRLKTGMKSCAEHLRRAHLAGLIDKRYEGRYVRHRLTALGARALQFCDEIG